MRRDCHLEFSRTNGTDDWTMVDQLQYAMIDLPLEYLKQTIRVTFTEEYRIDDGGLLRYETNILISQRVVSYRRKRTKE
jgi:hypothetical protein